MHLHHRVFEWIVSYILCFKKEENIIFLRFLTCVRRLTHVIAIGCPSVRLSVRHRSVTRRYCIKTAQPIAKLSSLSVSPMILVF